MDGSGFVMPQQTRYFPGILALAETPTAFALHANQVGD